jgi:hypothetical protein
MLGKAWVLGVLDKPFEIDCVGHRIKTLARYSMTVYDRVVRRAF